ncbi:MAG: ParB/RepB/Spo0J family partition protein, partial [Micropruina sp.]|nr:ParB/RepB/Spo0J family partition protein [Micropruina sp.]
PESLSVRTRLCQLGIDPRDDSPDHQGTHEAATEPRHITAKATRRGSGLVDSLRQAGTGNKLRVDDIADNPRNPPGRVLRIDDLVPSVTRVGVLVPILVTPVEEWLEKHPEDEAAVAGKAWVAQDGMRRLAAARQAGRADVPYQVRGVDVDQSLIRLHTSRSLRLTPIEEAQQYRLLLHSEGLTQQQIAAETGVSQGHVAKRLQLLALPESIQLAIDEGRVAVSQALRLVSAKDDDLAERIGVVLAQRHSAPQPAVDEEDGEEGEEDAAAVTDLDALARRVADDRAAEAGRSAAKLRADELEAEYCDDIAARLGNVRFTHQIYHPAAVKAAAADRNLLVVPTRSAKPDYYLIHADHQREDDDRRSRRAAETARTKALRVAAVTKVPPGVLQEALVTITLSGMSMLAKGGAAALAYDLARHAELTPDGLGDYAWRRSLESASEAQQPRLAWVVALAVLERHVRDSRTAWGWGHRRYFDLLRDVAGYIPTEWEQTQLDAAKEA